MPNDQNAIFGNNNNVEPQTNQQTTAPVQSEPQGSINTPRISPEQSPQRGVAKNEPLVPPTPRAQMPKNINPPHFSEQTELLFVTLNNMTKAGSQNRSRIVVSGDTGLGKTTYIEQLGRILGLESIIIEVPHLVEEHLINIPYLIKKLDNSEEQEYSFYNSEVNFKNKENAPPDANNYSVIQAESSLITSLRNLRKIPDAQYPAYIETKLNHYEKELIKSFLEENGQKTGMAMLNNARSHWDRLLFIDEYFRTTTPVIRSLLRGILDGRIGNDYIPPKTYAMYASNLEDTSGSIEKPEKYHEFDLKEKEIPSFENWIYFTVAGGVAKNIHWNEPVIEAFKKNMKDEHVSMNDVVRTSPRRWSEILFYLNNLYPFKGPDDVNIAYTHIKTQFQDDARNISGGFKVFEDILKDLAKQSGVSAALRPIPATKWRDILFNVVNSAVQIGSSKKYVPVVQGEPGIGKTAIVPRLESDSPGNYNLRTISIPCNTIRPDDLTGLTTPREEVRNGKRVKVTEFGKPPLLTLIEKLLLSKIEIYKQLLKERENRGELQGKTAEQAYQDWDSQKYKFCVFFDEFNRVTDQRVFNSLRKLILTKEFNERYRLDPSTVVIAAMNPGDSETMELTSHFKDAIEIIHAEASWSDFVAFMDNVEFPEAEKQTNPSLNSLAINIGKKFIHKLPTADFVSQTDQPTEKEFHWWSGSPKNIRISPRLLGDKTRNMMTVIHNVTETLEEKGLFNQDNLDQIKNQLINRIWRSSFEPMVRSRFYLELGINQVSEGLEKAFKIYLKKIIDDTLVIKNVEDISLSSILDAFVTGKTKNLGNTAMNGYVLKADKPMVYKDMNLFLDDLYANKNHDPIETLETVDKIVSSIAQATHRWKWSFGFIEALLDPIEAFLINKVIEPNAKEYDKSQGLGEAEPIISIWKNIVKTINQVDTAGGGGSNS